MFKCWLGGWRVQVGPKDIAYYSRVVPLLRCSVSVLVDSFSVWFSVSGSVCEVVFDSGDSISRLDSDGTSLAAILFLTWSWCLWTIWPPSSITWYETGPVAFEILPGIHGSPDCWKFWMYTSSPLLNCRAWACESWVDFCCCCLASTLCEMSGFTSPDAT